MVLIVVGRQSWSCLSWLGIREVRGLGNESLVQDFREAAQRFLMQSINSLGNHFPIVGDGGSLEVGCGLAETFGSQRTGNAAQRMRCFANR